MWLVGGVVGFLLFLGFILILILIIFLLVRRRKKAKQAGSAPASGGRAHPAPAHAPPAYSPSPSPPVPSPAHASPKPSPAPPPPMPHVMAGDQGMTVDLSRTVAITADGDSFRQNYGSIRFVSGPLSGQQFQVKPDGDFIGRDGGSSQIVIGDPRISKRHVWIGVRGGRVVIEDQNSRNGTFVNDPRSARVTETSLNVGDTVILGESDVARFEFHA
jgi:hypothetical protein